MFLRKFTFLVLPFFCLGLSEAQTPIDITSQLTFTTIDVPGAGYSGVWGINKTGEMVGNYGQDINGSDSHGFLYANGSFTYFDYPGQSVTVPTGINDAGLIVGSAGSNPVVGFLYNGVMFTTIHDGNNSATYTRGINNAGTVVGGAGTIYTTKGFEMRGGHFQTISPPPGNYVYVYATGLNNLGKVVGWDDFVGFVFARSKFQTISFPGSNQTQALGINDGGVIVGWYFSGACNCGFALRNGRYFSFSYPGASATFATGINASGQIVGEYTFDYNAYHGFVTSAITDADFR